MMWLPPVNFITVHYAWIVFIGLLSFVIVYPFGNLEAIDAYFFGVSSSTQSGLNTVDINILPFYQQLYIYVAPIITSLGFMNIFVVVVRLYWFEKKLGGLAPLNNPRHPLSHADVEAWPTLGHDSSSGRDVKSDSDGTTSDLVGTPMSTIERNSVSNNYAGGNAKVLPGARQLESQATLHVPPPIEWDQGKPFVEKDGEISGIDDNEQPVEGKSGLDRTGPSKRRPYKVEDIGFAQGGTGQFDTEPKYAPGELWPHVSPPEPRFPGLARIIAIGRNLRLQSMTKPDRERLGGVEYRSLKLLLKIVTGYFFGLHFFGIIALVPWIHRAPAKYTDHLAACGVDKTWWAFYSSQTMISNLGLTVTPDSMMSFKDAAWPLLVMTFLTYGGNTCYPIFLRLIIWTMSKIVPRSSPTHESLRFLLDHPRRCYNLLFPSVPTWILFGILFILNFVDVLLIIVLDLHNPAVNDLPLGPRVVSAIFQAGSSRHTGSATLNLADVNPAVQFSLLVMMYIAALPIGIGSHVSDVYEERTLGLYRPEAYLDESNARSYITAHINNQLNFDLWYIFLGTFVICIAESNRIADLKDPAFSVFAILFEVASAYCNVGLSLGHPAVSTSLAGEFKVISKLVICASMIRGRHRCMPYALDREVILPGEACSDGYIVERASRRLR